MQAKVQRAGRFLSGMVMPNLGAFIAWGLITALFIQTGWLPNERLAVLVDPMIKYLLPLLIGYTGGRMVGGQRGAIVGAVATMGVIVGTTMPMFIGAMVAGPLGGWCIKRFDKLVEGKIPAGFEMLVNNFSAGIIGGALAVFSLLGMGPVVQALSNLLAAGIDWFVQMGLLPLAAVFVEPAKVLFLNNALDHGVLGPMGVEQVATMGKSIFFMMVTNPGPGLGILLAYSLVGKGEAKQSAPGAILIHFFGGIHEIYFPYILMNPILILAAIAGGASGLFLFSFLGGGLVATPSPGSIIAFLAMTPPGGFAASIIGVVVSAAVSMFLSVVMLRFSQKDIGLEEAGKQVQAMKAQAKGETVPGLNQVRKIAFACDAGMGSSAMGATVLQRKLSQAGLAIEVAHYAIENVPQDTDLIVTHVSLGERARQSCPNARVIGITNFMAAPEYDELVQQLAGQVSAGQSV